MNTIKPEIIETAPVEEKALSIVDQAKAVKIVTAEDYTIAGGLWKSIGDMIKEVKDTFDPICDAAHKAHKAAVEKRAKFLDPLTAAQRSVKGLMSAYDTEQERLRKIEQAKLEAKLRKEEEERKLMEAIEAAEALRAQGATQEEISAETEAILEAPVTATPVILAKTTPKLDGGPAYQTKWRAVVTDIKALCLSVGTGKLSYEYVIGLTKDKDDGTISSPALNRKATTEKETMSVPGVEARSKRV